MALGAKVAVGFVESLGQHAADVQKQGEAISAEFGSAGDKIKEFADKSAASLGLSAHEAESTATRFGLLFANLHIGQKAAAGMTINLEQLAAATSQIRNVPVETFLQQLPLALGGNIRSLRQLGLATDAHTIKVEALKQGLISNLKEGLTPQTRALAIYSLAVARLPALLAQAQAHQGDLANVTRRLSAEFDNEKDKIGKELLPTFVELANFADRILPTAFAGLGAVIKGSVRGLTEAYNIIDKLTGFMGGATKTIEAFVAAFATVRILKWVQTFAHAKDPILDTTKAMAASIGNIESSLTGMNTVAATTTAGVANDFTKMTAQVKADAIALQASLAPFTHGVRPLTGPQAGQQKIRNLLTGIQKPSGAEELRSPTTGRFASVRPALSTGGKGFLLSAEGDAKRADKAMQGMASTAASTSAKIKSSFSSAFAGFKSHAVSAAGGARAALATIATSSKATASLAAAGFKSFFAGLKTVAITTAAGIRAALIEAFPILLLTVAIQLLIDHFGLVKKVVFDVVHGIENSWTGLKDVLIGLAKTIGGAMATYLTLPIRAFLEATSHLGFLSVFGINIGHEAKKGLALLKSVTTDFAVQGAEQVKKGGLEIANAMGDAFSNLGKKLSDKNDPKSFAAQVADAAITNEEGLRNSLAKLREQIKALSVTNNSAVDNARAHLRDLGRSLADAIKQEAIDVKDAVNSAKSNLFSYSQTLAQSVGQMLDAPIQAAQNQISRLQNKKALDDLRRSVLLPGGKQLSNDPTKALAELRDLANRAGGVNKGAVQSFILQYRQALLQVKQDQVNVTKEATSKRLGDLAEALNNHEITLSEFKKRVRATLAKDKIPYQQAGHLLGTYFIDGFNQQTADLFAQAAAILKGPNVKGTSAFAQPIVKPLETLIADQEKIRKINDDIRKGEVTLKNAIAAHAKKQLAATEKQTKLIAQQNIILAALHQLAQRRAEQKKRGDEETRLKLNPGRGLKPLTLYIGIDGG